MRGQVEALRGGPQRLDPLRWFRSSRTPPALPGWAGSCGARSPHGKTTTPRIMRERLIEVIWTTTHLRSSGVSTSGEDYSRPGDQAASRNRWPGRSEAQCHMCRHVLVGEGLVPSRPRGCIRTRVGTSPTPTILWRPSTISSIYHSAIVGEGLVRGAPQAWSTAATRFPGQRMRCAYTRGGSAPSVSISRNDRTAPSNNQDGAVC